MDLAPFRDEPSPALLAAPAQDVAAAFRFHARPEPKLSFAGPLGWLVGAFHGRISE
jgi:hypothetical protein